MYLKIINVKRISSRNLPLNVVVFYLKNVQSTAKTEQYCVNLFQRVTAFNTGAYNA